jgi:hypothetical protein
MPNEDHRDDQLPPLPNIATKRRVRYGKLLAARHLRAVHGPLEWRLFPQRAA